MATLYPKAEWRPLGPQTQPKMSAHDIICLHTMVGSLSGTDAMFKKNGYGGTESHFGVGHQGIVYQWQDLEYTADANYQGNRTVISIETADYGEGPFGDWDTRGDNVPPWTPAQIETNAQIIAWCCKKYNIPCILIPDTKPGRRGIGYHAQGVPGNELVPGGIIWSIAKGKVCPGRKRIAQIPTVIARARRIIEGTDGVIIDQEENPFMALSDAEQRELLNTVRKLDKEMAKLKPGVRLPARSTNQRVQLDDEFGHTMNAAAEAADARKNTENIIAAIARSQSQKT